jgi:translation initiation factor 2 gamma subunit (eIF-2gamma)
LIADELKYEYISKTFDSSLGYQDIEIVKCGDIETKRVYLGKDIQSQNAYVQNYTARLISLICRFFDNTPRIIYGLHIL